MTGRLLGLLAILLIGFGALPFASSAQAPQATPLELHIVKPGETLFRIALAYNFFAEQVAAANGISDMNSIRVGQRLIIPMLTDGYEQRLTHIVAAGETLASIAAAYSLSQGDLLARNNLASAEALRVGMELVIVAGSAEPAISPVGERDASTAISETGAISGPLPEVGGQAILLPDQPMEAFTQTVASGDTLSYIGSRYGLSVAELAAANNLLDPNALRIGQRLVIPGIQLPRLGQALPSLVTAMTIEPFVLESGRSARLDIVTNQRAKLSGQFLGQALRFISDEAGKRHMALFGIPMFTGAAVYPLRIDIESGDGEITTATANLQVIGGGYGYQTITINNSELLAREVEHAETALLMRQTSDFTNQRHFSGALNLPSAAAMNAVFGALRSYNGSGYDRYHSGVDFAGAPGTSVLAAAGGRVKQVNTLQIRGNTTLIDHGWGIYTLYAHQQDTLVQPGEIVAAGQVIGTIGSTGRSTGPHLHWELWLNGVNVDPMQWTRQVFV